MERARLRKRGLMTSSLRRGNDPRTKATFERATLAANVRTTSTICARSSLPGAPERLECALALERSGDDTDGDPVYAHARRNVQGTVLPGARPSVGPRPARPRSARGDGLA